MTVLHHVQPATSSRSRTLTRLTIVGIVLYVAVDVLLAFVRPQYSLLHNAESDYGHGPWFWVMDLNFLLRCALTLALIAGLQLVAGSDPRVRRGLALLTVWALCSGVLAFFADDIEGQPLRGSGEVHLVLAFVAFVAVAIGTVVLTAALRSHPAFQSSASALMGLSIAGVAGLLLLGRAAGRRNAPGGLYERIFLGIELLWMFVAALAVARADRGPTKATPAA